MGRGLLTGMLAGLIVSALAILAASVLIEPQSLARAVLPVEAAPWRTAAARELTVPPPPREAVVEAALPADADGFAPPDRAARPTPADVPGAPAARIGPPPAAPPAPEAASEAPPEPASAQEAASETPPEPASAPGAPRATQPAPAAAPETAPASSAEPASEASSAEPAPEASSAEPAPEASSAEPAPEASLAEPAPEAPPVELPVAGRLLILQGDAAPEALAGLAEAEGDLVILQGDALEAELAALRLRLDGPRPPAGLIVAEGALPLAPGDLAALADILAAGPTPLVTPPGAPWRELRGAARAAGIGVIPAYALARDLPDSGRLIRRARRDGGLLVLADPGVAPPADLIAATEAAGLSVVAGGT